MLETQNDENEMQTENSKTEEEMVIEETPAAVENGPDEEMPAAAATEQPSSENLEAEQVKTENMETEKMETENSEIEKAEKENLKTEISEAEENAEAENLSMENGVAKPADIENSETENLAIKEEIEIPPMENETAENENESSENGASEVLPPENETPAVQTPENETPEVPPPENGASEVQPPETPVSENSDKDEVTTLNPLNEPEPAEVETKGKHRRYWTPKEEERFYQIWGRENWRLTRHGKNTVYFAKWAEEMRERFNFDIKPEEVQCKVNQTRAKFRQVKKHLESDKNYVKWKKYDVVEKILKNQYRSKDDDPVPIEALENNRDVSPTELLNTNAQPMSPNSTSNMSTIPEQGINLSMSASGDHHLTEEINMSNVSLSDQNLFNNNSQSGTSFSTELFGSDQLEIKQEIETDIKREGFMTDYMSNEGGINNIDGIEQNVENQSYLHQQLTQSLPQQVPFSNLITENNSNNIDLQQANQIQQQQLNPNPNSLLINNRLIQNHSIIATSNADGIVNINTNHVNNTNSNNINTMQPPKATPAATTPRKRNRTPSAAAVAAAAASAAAAAAALTPVTADSLETLYLDEVRKKNVLLVEQGEMNRKRLRLEERKVKLMEDFFPKFMNLQEEILQKLNNVTTNSTPPPAAGVPPAPADGAINIKLED